MTGMYKYGKIAAVKTLVIAVIAIVGALSGGPVAAANSDYLLGSGDKVKITVFGEPDLRIKKAKKGTSNLNARNRIIKTLKDGLKLEI